MSFIADRSHTRRCQSVPCRVATSSPPCAPAGRGPRRGPGVAGNQGLVLALKQRPQSAIRPGELRLVRRTGQQIGEARRSAPHSQPGDVAALVDRQRHGFRRRKPLQHGCEGVLRVRLRPLGERGRAAPAAPSIAPPTAPAWRAAAASSSSPSAASAAVQDLHRGERLELVGPLDVGRVPIRRERGDRLALQAQRLPRRAAEGSPCARASTGTPAQRLARASATLRAARRSSGNGGGCLRACGESPTAWPRARQRQAGRGQHRRRGGRRSAPRPRSSSR